MSKSPKFKSPPLNEVVCGVRFDPVPLTAQQISDLRDKFKRGFPRVESAPRIQVAGGTIDLTGNAPIQRLWLISDNDDKVIQIQDDHFLFNWRKRPPNEKYPNFEKIFDEFRKRLAEFEAFCVGEDLGPLKFQSCELSYVNLVSKGAGWDKFSDLGKIFTDLDFSLADREHLSRLAGFGLSFGYNLPDDKGVLSALYNVAKRVEDQTTAIQLQLSAKGLGSKKTKEAVLDWFELAHEYIVFGFCELTTENARKNLWKQKL